MIFNYISRTSLAEKRLSMSHLGMLLRSKTPLPQALRQIALSSESRQIKIAAAKAADLLASGHDCAEVFSGSQVNVFPPHSRYILAAPLSDDLKGLLLSDWQRRSNDEFNIKQYLYQPLQSIAIGMLTLISLFMFVLPQFREIMLGLEIRTTGLAQWVIEFASGSDGFAVAVFMPLILVFLLIVVFYVGKSFFMAHETLDEMNFFRMIEKIPVEHRYKVIEIMSASHNFPRLSAKFKKFASAVNNGSEIAPACAIAGLDDFFCWFMQLSMIDEGNSEILAQGATLLESRLTCSIEKTGRLVEIFSVLIQGLLFGIVVYAIFQAMMSIMLGGIT